MSPISTVLLRGVELSVRDEGRGTPVVWGHGLTSSMAHEDEIGLLNLGLPADRYRMIRYDARGHGASTGSTDPADYHYDQLASDQLALMEQLGLAEVVLGGASMGSVTALHTAVAVPDRVQALVLVIPPTAWEARVDRGALYEAGAEVIAQAGIEAFIELAATEPLPPVFAAFSADLLEATSRRYRDLDPQVLPAIFRGVGGSDLPDREQIAKISVPTLVLCWEGDPVHPRATAEELDRLLPHSELHVAADLAGVMEWPAIARRFLDDVTRS